MMTVLLSLFLLLSPKPAAPKISLLTTGPTKDTTITFLWREPRYLEDLQDTFSTIIINEEYCKVMSDAERAAIGFAAYNIGSECEWDGEATEGRTNLKCVVPSALGLGYQCSDTQITFLRTWFRNDPKSLKELNGCPTTPNTSTIQDTFDEIKVTTKGDKIILTFKANGVNMREDEAWSWSEKITFKRDGDSLKITKHSRSKTVEH
ncbi:MAG: hypothetical protein Q8896_13360 [Bacteroidota bacterium]|nr:hypothetical protein [Bacteroidota bacterium]